MAFGIYKSADSRRDGQCDARPVTTPLAGCQARLSGEADSRPFEQMTFVAALRELQ